LSSSSTSGALDFGGGRFVVQRRLGTGGTGVVYQVLDRERNQVVALKTLRDVDGNSIVRFKREFRALADVTHPNLVSLYELISEGDELFFTMELVAGAQFLRWVRGVVGEAHDTSPLSAASETLELGATMHGKKPSRARAGVVPDGRVGGTLDPGRLRASLRQLAEGVAAIHGAGMIHRDLKPSNVLVRGDGLVKILDFGLVTELARERSREQNLAGTAAYMSPEQGARQPLTPASDWYSVGVMLYEALAGRLPFVGAPTDLLMDKQQYDAAPPHQLAPDAPQDLDALCSELLRRDPEARPTARDVLRRLGSAVVVRHTSSGTSSVAEHALVGREAHLGALDDAFAAARRGRTVVTFVHGSSGMGKSSLVRHFLDRLEESGVLVLSGRCYERESVPYKGVDAIIDAVSQYLGGLQTLEAEALLPRDVLALARLFPALRHVEAVAAAPRRNVETPDPQELRRRAFNALRELLARIADRRPVVLAVDDLQWGDIDSAALLAAVLRPPDAPALLLVACHRSEDGDSAFLHGFRAELELPAEDVREVAVGALAPDDAQRLAELLLGADRENAGDQARRIAQESSGNPFFLHELALHVRDGEAEGEAQLISLDEVLRARLRRLSPSAARLLATIAVAGRPIAVAVAQRAAEVSDQTPLAVLKAGNLVRTRGHSDAPVVECYHDRIRDAALTLLDAERLKRTHLRVAIALESSVQPDVEALAVHFRAAGDAERAAGFATQAAERAADALAFDRAARLYRMALELRPAEHASAHRLRVSLGDALANSGRGPEAARAYLSATATASAAERLDLLRRAAMQFLFSGHFPEGTETLRTVLAAVGMQLAETPRAALATLLIGRARVRLRGLSYRERDASQISPDQLMRIDVADAAATGLGMVDSLRAAGFQARHFLWAMRAGEPWRVSRAYAAEACFVSMAGVRAAARTQRAVDELAAVTARLGRVEADAILLAVRAVTEFQVGRWRLSLGHCLEAERLLRERCTGFTWERTTVQIFTCFCYALLGELRTVSQLTPLLVKEAQERGDLYFLTSVLSSVGYYSGLLDDVPERARRAVAEATARWPVRDAVHMQHFNSMVSEALVDCYLGAPERAWQRMSELWPALERALILRVQTLRVSAVWQRSRVAVMLVARGRRDLLGHVAAAARKLRGEKVGYAESLGTLAAAEVAHLRGNADVALALLTESEQRFDALEMRFHEACARRQRGRLVGGDEGAALVARADAYFAAQGAVRPDKMVSILAPGFD
jgi:eukaryotic-like serine/threonine-protein kinase